MALKIEKNITIACYTISIDGIVCECNTELTISENYICTLTLSNISRECYEQVKDKESVLVILRKDGIYMSVITSYLQSSSFRHCDTNPEKPVITLVYISSILIMDYYPIENAEPRFNGFTCKISDGLELLGTYPYKINEVEDFSSCNLNVNINVEATHCIVDNGFSYFVVPLKKKGINGILLAMDYKIQFIAEQQYSLDEIKEILHNVCLFFEIMCGEIVTVTEVSLLVDTNLYDYIGFCNYPKQRLSCLKNGLDTRSFLRKSIFKVTDFGDSVSGVLNTYNKLIKENELAYEAYKQVLLDEETKIISYNKFLKVMQMIEGYERDKKDEEAQNAFDLQKEAVLQKLTETDDLDFIKKYTNYNGQNFRKCMKEFTCEAMQLVSGLSKSKANRQSNDIIDKIINDRDVYTHASKEKAPILTFDELGAVVYCYKTFFRILSLEKMGMDIFLIRKRLKFDRQFVPYYKNLFALKVDDLGDDNDTGEFDNYMWGYDDK